ncbi:hypothetical protein [Blastococcus mobilis]|uniref:HNH endonuclease n=1 Tax=Blastococcus mobilis TaxID=1938746 RepID=A0A238VEJ3_9ACTN|nr:hypothetical protein [Blastococcus mobilis]SNR32822.1 hypothetical protein SAMN06272737_10357 [Blastococcus mobilis]
MKRKPLKRGKPLARKARGPRQTPPKPSKSPDMPLWVRHAVYARSGDRCEVGATAECRLRAGWFDNVTGRSIHHRRPRRMGGTRAVDIHDPANLLAVCGNGTRGCHGWIERNRVAAMEQGWLLGSGADPVSRACTLRDGRTVLLRVDGYVVLFGADGRAA